MGKQSKQKGSPPQKKKDEEKIPLECSQEEFDDLLSQVKALNAEEATEELLDCARYGDLDPVRAVLDCFPEIVDAVDAEDSTALHKCCANGHVSTTKLLLQRGAAHTTNRSGNTPLHWAAGAGHSEIVKILLENERLKPDMDVLAKNKFGRSSLTEGFASKETEVARLLLEHDSATEERLLMGGKEIDVSDDEEGGNGDGKEKPSIVHEFNFRNQPYEEKEEMDEKKMSEQALLIRELPIAHADNPFGDKAIEDTTGYGIWCASLAMARWMATPDIAERFANKTVLELGAGCGVPGLAAAFYSRAQRVYITDLNPTTVDNMQHNIDLNQTQTSPVSTDEDQQPLQQWNERVIASSIDWDDETTWPDEKLDFVIGSDLIYQSNIVPLLKKVVLGLLKPKGGRFLYVCPDTGRDGLDDFIKSMKSDGCSLVNECVAPQSYHANPLMSQNDDQCFLHFHELTSSTYMLYEFKCSQEE